MTIEVAKAMVVMDCFSDEDRLKDAIYVATNGRRCVQLELRTALLISDVSIGLAEELLHTVVPMHVKRVRVQARNGFQQSIRGGSVF